MSDDLVHYVGCPAIDDLVDKPCTCDAWDAEQDMAEAAYDPERFPAVPETLDLATQHTLAERRKGEEVDRYAAADAAGATPEWIIKKMKSVVDQAMEGHPVTDRDGEYVGHVKELGTATRALELLAKHRGMLREQTETHHSGGIDIRLIGVNTQDLT